MTSVDVSLLLITFLEKVSKSVKQFKGILIVLCFSYVWRKNGAQVSLSTRVQLVRGDLEIFNVTSEDSGMYWCNASNVHGSDIINTNLLIRCKSVRISLCYLYKVYEVHTQNTLYYHVVIHYSS